MDKSSFLGKLRMKSGIAFDLPTDAQREYACRAGTTTRYSHGDKADGDYMWYGDNSGNTFHEVGMKKPNPWGFYDMHGNVYEWCLDWSGLLAYGADPKGVAAGTERVHRGGSWSWGTDGASAIRRSDPPSFVETSRGLRLCAPAQ